MKKLNELSADSDQLDGVSAHAEPKTSSRSVWNIAGKIAIMVATACGSADRPGDAQAKEPDSAKQLTMLPVSPIAGAPVSALSASEPDRQKIDGWKDQIRTQRLAVAYANIEKADPKSKPSMLMELLKRLKASMEKSLSQEETIALRELAFETAKMCGNFTDALDLHRAIESDTSLLQPGFIKDEIAFLQHALSMPVNQFASRKSAINVALDERRNVLQAIDTLSADPDNKEANQAVGAYLTLGRYASEAGFPYLAKGTDPVMVELASADNLMNAQVWENGAERIRPEWRKFVAERAEKLKKNDQVFVASPMAGDSDMRETQSLPAQAPAKPSAVANSTEVARPPITGKKINLLKPAANEPPLFNPIWGKTGMTPDGKLYMNKVGENGTCKMQILRVPTGNFSVRAKVESLQGGKILTFVIPLGDGECWVRCSKDAISIEQNNGTDEKEIPNRKKVEFQPKDNDFHIEVRDNKDDTFAVSVSLNGELINTIDFKNLPIRSRDGWLVGPKQSLALWTYDSDLTISSLGVTTITGRVVTK